MRFHQHIVSAKTIERVLNRAPRWRLMPSGMELSDNNGCWIMEEGSATENLWNQDGGQVTLRHSNTTILGIAPLVFEGVRCTIRLTRPALVAHLSRADIVRLLQDSWVGPHLSEMVQLLAFPKRIPSARLTYLKDGHAEIRTRRQSVSLTKAAQRMWHRLDGKHTLLDILQTLQEVGHELPAPAALELTKQLNQNGCLTTTRIRPKTIPSRASSQPVCIPTARYQPRIGSTFDGIHGAEPNSLSKLAVS